ncbi:MAG: hypothetical protein RIQ81_1112 [Pseudomonadota bacterium]
MANSKAHHNEAHDEALSHPARSSSGAMGAWLVVALVMSILLAIVIAHDLSGKGPANAGDWLQIVCALGLVSILTTMTFLRKQVGPGADEVAGEASMALFELDFENPYSGSVTQGRKRKTSIGSVASSIRQQATDIADITGKLANAYSTDSGEPGAEQGRLRRITEAQASALAQIDSLQKEAQQTIEEIAGYREKLAALEAQARFQSEHIAMHARDLATITGEAQALTQAAGTLQAIQLAASSNHERASKNAIDVATELKLLVAELEKTLLAFRTSANATGFGQSGVEAFSATLPTAVSTNPSASCIEIISALDGKATALRGLLDSLAEIVKLLQVNLNFAATADSINGPGSARVPHLLDEEAANLTEASTILAAARDMASGLALAIERAAGTTSRTLDEYQAREQHLQKTAERLAGYNVSLAKMAGTMAQTTGEVRFAALNMIQRLESVHRTTTTGSPQFDQGAVAREIQAAMANTIKASQRIATEAAHLSVTGEMINQNATRTHANVQELRILASNAAGNSQRLQHATSAAAVKTEGLVSLTRGLVRKEDGAARRALANSVRISVQQKVHMIDEFALRVLAMEESAKMSKGPSPAIEREAPEAKLPQVEFPVQ